jgi:hypothetical protein
MTETILHSGSFLYLFALTNGDWRLALNVSFCAALPSDLPTSSIVPSELIGEEWFICTSLKTY